MKTENDVALSNLIELDNDKARMRAGWKMLISFIVLAAVYMWRAWILGIFRSKTVWIKDLLVIIMLVVLTALLLYFCRTTKILQDKMHFSRAQIIWSCVLLIVILPELLFLLMQTIDVFRQSFSKIYAVFMMAIVAGIIEELLFRGLLFNSMVVFFYHQKYCFLIASMISSGLFGLVHLINVTHQPLQSTIGQIIFIFGIGLVYAYLRLFSNGIIWCILFHFLTDFKPAILSSNTGTHDVSLLQIFLVMLPIMILAIICIWLFNRQYLKMNK